MRAHRARVQVPDDHELRVTLPLDFPTGVAEVIVVQVSDGATAPARRLTVDELIAARLQPPPGIRPVTTHDIELAIAAGAAGVRGV